MARWFRWFSRSTPLTTQVVAVSAPVAIFHKSPEVVRQLRPVERRDGLVWIDAAGKIQIRNPQGQDGHYPVLDVPNWDAVRVSVNGKLCVGQRVLEEGMIVQTRCLVQAPESRFEIVTSPSEMEATLVVMYRAGERRVLEPTLPARRLAIRPRIIPIEPIPVTFSQVEMALARVGVTAGLIDLREIERFLATRTSGSLVIAQGIPPRPGGATIEMFGPAPFENQWMVEAGAVIGRRHIRSAREGVTITGRRLPAPIEPEREIRLGRGVTVMTHEPHLVAARPGLVVFESGVLDVVGQDEMPSLMPGDDILFIDGDLSVHGDVSGRRLVVLGNLSIEGDLTDSRVVAGGAVVVGGARVGVHGGSGNRTACARACALPSWAHRGWIVRFGVDNSGSPPATRIALRRCARSGGPQQVL